MKFLRAISPGILLAAWLSAGYGALGTAALRAAGGGAPVCAALRSFAMRHAVQTANMCSVAVFGLHAQPPQQMGRGGPPPGMPPPGMVRGCRRRRRRRRVQTAP